MNDILNTQISSEKMKVAEDMAGSIVHELRTPLCGIRMNVQFLEKYLPILMNAYHLAKQNGLSVPPIPDHHIEGLKDRPQVMQEELHQTQTIIETALKNLKGGQEKPEDWGFHRIRDCIEEMFKRYPFDDPEDRQKVQWDLQEDFTFHGSKMLVIQALFNLLSNALYFIKKSSKKEANIVILTKTKSNENLLYFIDTGTGIDANDLSKLFERYFSKRLNGTGLGLAFCKNVMQRMDGNILCHSTQGEFTEFVLVFPKPFIKHHLHQNHTPTNYDSSIQKSDTQTPSDNQLVKKTVTPIPNTFVNDLKMIMQKDFDNAYPHLPTALYKTVLTEIEPCLFQMVLKKTKLNQSKAARILGISRFTLRKKLLKYNLCHSDKTMNDHLPSGDCQ